MNDWYFVKTSERELDGYTDEAHNSLKLSGPANNERELFNIKGYPQGTIHLPRRDIRYLGADICLLKISPGEHSIPPNAPDFLHVHIRNSSGELLNAIPLPGPLSISETLGQTVIAITSRQTLWQFPFEGAKLNGLISVTWSLNPIYGLADPMTIWLDLEGEDHRIVAESSLTFRQFKLSGIKF